MTTDIVITADSVNLTNCAREQIHIPSSIQPHGALLVVDPSSFKIIQASQNTDQILQYPYEELINSPLDKILSQAQIEQIKDCLNQDFAAINPIRITVKDQDFNLIIHKHTGFLFAEFEPIDQEYKNDFLTFYNLTRRVIDEMQSTTDLLALSDVIVRNIRTITEFDRVMVYRFDEDGSGLVIAEGKRAELDSFHGLHYPATDIPLPAQRLYKLNYIRLIPDIDYEAIPLPKHPETNEPFDLSYSTLRSVSPLHVEYLHNMGVQASMSISIIYENKLWGLIACHHYQAKYLPYEVRSACEFLGKVMSLNLVAREEQANLSYNLEIKQKLSYIIDQLGSSTDIIESLYNNSDALQSLVKAEGIAICFHNNIRISGVTPERKQIMNLVAWLKKNQNRNFFYSDRLPQIYPKASTFKSVASGIIILFLSRVENSYIIWFRPEVAQTVTWAGNPNKKAILEDDGTITLSPRKSFELWKQNVTGRSLPWLSCEIQQIIEFRTFLVDIIFKKSNELVELNFELQRSNDELDAFAYIASHDLKEPLRGIYNYSYLLLEDYEQQLDDDGSRKLKMLMSLTKRMEKLIDALLYYSRLGRQELKLQTVDIKEMILQDIKPVLEVSQQESFDIRIPHQIPSFQADKTLVEEVFMNLITNGLKYNTQAGKWIEVGAFKDKKKSSQTIFYVQDNGIGIEPEYLDAIFRIFKRLHGQKKFGGGTGAGLTIVKKIVERHGGKIWVESDYGKGTTFYFTFAEEA